MRAADAIRPSTWQASDHGAALVLVLLTGVLITALGVLVLRVVDVDTSAAAAARDGAVTEHAAEALLEYAIDELARMPDWSPVLGGLVGSRFRDASLQPVSPVAGRLDLVALTASLQAETNVRWAAGGNTPQWRLFASGPLESLAGTLGPPLGPYLMAWAADDEGDADGNPGIDANSTIRVSVEARGRRGSRRLFDAVIARTATPGVVRLVSWKEGR
jgi:hypothetical protein